MEATTKSQDITATPPIGDDSATEATTNSLNTTSESIEEQPEEYTEEEIKKAEEFKTQGNDCFKGNLPHPHRNIV